LKRIKIRIVQDINTPPDEFEVSAEQPVRYLINNLLTGLGLGKKNEKGKEIAYWFEKAGKPIHPDLTLLMAGIGNNSTIVLKSGDDAPFPLEDENVVIKPLPGVRVVDGKPQQIGAAGKIPASKQSSTDPMVGMKKLDDPKERD